MRRQDDGILSREQLYYFDFDGAGRPTLYTVDRNKITLKECVDRTHHFYKEFAKRFAIDNITLPTYNDKPSRDYFAANINPQKAHKDGFRLAVREVVALNTPTQLILSKR